MSRVIAIVQARIGSSRLPGKVLMPLGGKTVLHHVLTRCAHIPGVSEVCCAIPDSAENESIAREADRAGAVVFRGKENDVLDRYYRAAEAMHADVVLRVTSDCPLIDPKICGAVLNLFYKRKADYATNNMPPSWPHGLDCEVFSFKSLHDAASLAKNSDEREHVTPWIRNNVDLNRVNFPSHVDGLANYRWTLDYVEDMMFFRAVFDSLQADKNECHDMDDILRVLRNRPEIAEINRMRHDAQRLQPPSINRV